MKVKKRLFFTLICFVILSLCFPTVINADMGPKPGVHVSFKNMNDELCYATLLSKVDSTGPSYVWDGTEENARYKKEDYEWLTLDYDNWLAFVEYKDSDGYYFLQEAWLVSETNELAWTYYPPDNFKILLYYPETGTFLASDIYETYAFDSYYTVDMSAIKNSAEISDDTAITAVKSYNYQDEIISFIARVFITLVIEMIIAYLYGFREKAQLKVLIVVNVITQIILNVLLNIVNYQAGAMGFTIFYILFEMAVTVIEWICYCIFLKKVSLSKKDNGYYFLYSLIANAISFGIGIIVSHLVPGIF